MSLMNRRHFMQRTGSFIAGSMMLPNMLRSSNVVGSPRLTILFTNDLHSRVEPRHPASREHPEEGGFRALGYWIDRIRKETEATLLLDAGDVIDTRSTWVERWGGDVEFRWIREAGYDAVLLGDQELLLGLERLGELAARWSPPWVVSNYRVTGTPIEGAVRPFNVVNRGGVRVGIFGLGVPFTGLVPPEKRVGLAYGDPVEWAAQMVHHLRTQWRCDYCICLSHLGFEQPSGTDDREIARRTPGLDLIVGGHTHTRLTEPVRIAHDGAGETVIVQTGGGGVRLGRVDLCREEQEGVQRWTTCVQPLVSSLTPY